MGYANCIPRVKPLLNFRQCKEAADLGHGEATLDSWTVGQLDSGLKLSSLSRSSALRSETEDHEFGRSPTKPAGKPGCTKSSIKFP